MYWASSTTEILHGYSVVRVCLDDHHDRTVPVAVVAWDTGGGPMLRRFPTNPTRLDLRARACGEPSPRSSPSAFYSTLRRP